MKKESKLKKQINELKKTNRGKAILKLIKWSIFFVILFIILIISSFIKPTEKNQTNSNNNSSSNEQIEQVLSSKTINELKNELLNNTYNYKYEITINNDKYIYNGTKNKDNESGYKETSQGVIKYYIDNTGTYEEKLNEKIPLSNLYENLDYNYINLDNLLNNIASYELILISSDVDLTYAKTINNITWRIIINKNKIKSININKSNDEELNYNYYYTFAIEVPDET